MAGKAIQAIFGTRSRMESVLAWGAAVGITYAWYKWDASKQVESGGAPEFTAAESEAWNQKVRVAHPEAFTAAVAKETARAEAAGKASLAAKVAEAGSASQPPEDSPQNSAAS